MDNRNYKIIAVDFDGTLCYNVWPGIGDPKVEVIEFIKQEKIKGSKIILWTCREGNLLQEAVSWCANHGIYFDAVNDNLRESIDMYEGNSRKIFADIYIDDKAIDNILRLKPFKKILAIEDGSVDLDFDSLYDHNPDILPIIYRQGSCKPELIDIYI